MALYKVETQSTINIFTAKVRLVTVSQTIRTMRCCFGLLFFFKVSATVEIVQLRQHPLRCRVVSIMTQCVFDRDVANKTHANLVEDWICPTARPPHSLVKMASSGSVDVTGRTGAGAEAEATLDELYDEEGYGGDLLKDNSLQHGILPVHLLFIILGALSVLLVVVGFISYRKAMQS